MKEVTIYDDHLGLITIDVSSLSQTQYIMLLIALEYDVGKSCSELVEDTDTQIQYIFKSLSRLQKNGHVKKIKFRDLPDEIREYISQYKDNKRVKAYYFPTSGGIRYIKYILKKNDLDILLKKIPDEDELIV